MIRSTWKVWIRFCVSYNRFFEKVFRKWAGITATHPWKVIIIGVLLALGLTAGMLRFSQKEHKRLYFPENTQSNQDLSRAEKSFPYKIIPDEFFITMKNEETSVLNVVALRFVLKLHKKIMSGTGIRSSCYKIKRTHNIPPRCMVLTLLELFNFDENLITDTSIQQTIADVMNNPKKLIYGRPASMMFEDMLGKFQFNSSSNTSYASAIRVMYMMKFPEDEATADVVKKTQKKSIDILLNQQTDAEQQGLKLFFQMSRSIDDGIGESFRDDMTLVVVSIALMVGFIFLSLFKLHDRVGSQVLIGLVGILCCIFGISSGFGFVLLTGNRFLGFVGTLPFLVLGVGIDDMFIMIDALAKTPANIEPTERLQKALSHVGSSVTLTTLTDVAAFAISSSSQIPAIRIFCFYAIMTIFFTYLLILTVFLAVLALDLKRVENGRWDLFMCIRSKNENNSQVEMKTTTISQKIMKRWAEFLMLNPVRVVVIILSFGLLAAGVYGTFHLKHNFDSRQVLSDDFYFIRWQKAWAKHFKVGHTIGLITDDPLYDYSDRQNQQMLIELDYACRTNSYMKNITVNWMAAYLESEIYLRNPKRPFYENLNRFLKENPMYYTDLRINSRTGHIKSSRIICKEIDTQDWEIRADAMINMKNIMKKYFPTKSTFPIALDYYYRELIVYVVPETTRNIALSAAAILIITTPFLINPLTVLILFCGFVALIFELFGLMALWDLSLNSISSLTMIMAIGFAADYSEHVAHSYLHATGDTPEKRMVEALTSIGFSVFKGGFTTLLGIVVLRLAKAPVFLIFFKMFFGIVVLGLINGLVLLPVFLSVFVRWKIDINDEHENNKRDTKSTVIENKNNVQASEIPDKKPAVDNGSF